MGTPDDAQVSTCVALCRFCLSVFAYQLVSGTTEILLGTDCSVMQ